MNSTNPKFIARSLARILGWAAYLQVMAIAIAGCSTVQGQALEVAAREIGRAEAAAALDNADWWRCRASPVGAVVDRYGASTMRWDAYRQSCVGFWPAEQTTLPIQR
jgi:hypothetical protein